MKEKVIFAVYAAIEKVNVLLKDDLKLEKSLNTVIVGERGTLDSVGIINFIITTEECIKEGFGVELSLANEEVLSLDNARLSSVAIFVDYIVSLLEAKIK